MRIVKIDFEKAAVIKGIRNLDMEKKEFYKNKKDPLIKEIIKNGIKL